MVSKTKDPSKCKTIDALRIKKYIGCFIYKNREQPLDVMVRNARAPVENMFNCHEWCDGEWCFAKSITEESQNYAVEKCSKVSNCSLL